MTFDRTTGNVGIGTTTPNTKLDVNGNISLKSDSASSLFWGGTLTSLGRANGPGDFSSSAVAGDLVLRSVGKLILQSGTGIGAIVIDTSNNINIDSGILYIDASNNNVGIGTTQPNKKLHVTGDTRIEGSLIVNGTVTQINTNVGTTEQLLITNDGTGPALIVNQTGAQPIIEFQDDGSTCFKIFDGGNLGIGTASKIVSVDISGNLKLSGSITGSGSGLTALNASNITGNINVAQGGTGLTTLTAGQLLIGGTNVIQTSNLTWNSSTNTLSATNFVGSGSGLTALNASNITGNINVAQGGTGLTTLTSGQILIGGANVTQSANLTWNSGTNTLSATNFVGSGAGLTALSATNITGNINVAQGGTGATTLTSGQILVGNGTSTLTQSANLTWDNTNNRLGIGKTNPGYVLDVNGAINATELRTNGTIFTGSIWTIGTSNKIYYNTANIGIGTTDPLSLLDINATNYTGALLTLDAGIINATTQMARSIGKPLMKIGKTSYSTTAGDYYGIGFGYSPTSSDFNCAEIGTIITSVAGKETGDIVFSTRPDTTNVAATERMRIWSNGAVTIAGNVCIGKATPSTALDVVGTVTATLFSGSGASLTSLNASNISSGTLTAANGGTGCTSLSTVFFDTSGGVLSLKNGGTGSSQWTTLNNNIYFNTANVGIGITNPNYKLHVEDGILFIGDSMFLNNSSSNIANNYILLFDNTYNGTTGSGIAANKIRLMNDTSNNILAGFGIENNSITYHSGSSGSHTFYSGTSSSNYGTGRFQIDQSGNITCTGDFAAFTSISDKRLKTNIIKLDSSMDIIKKLNPVKFFWKYNDFIIKNKQGTEDVGFIAQEIEEVIPLATGEYKVINSEETYKNIKYERIIPYLVKSIQELIDKVDTLEQEIIRLKCYI
ncbi:MAG: hypothetical protein EBZ69_02920 [Alphaproteobacteria bacterium]|nr:hypothetical protein [Alphaproteobacteria bacterium]